MEGSWTGPAGSAYDVLKEDGYNVSVVQNPTSWLVDDVAVAERMPAAQNGSAILVVHSYGGVVITEPGTIRRSRDQEPAAWCAGASDPAASGRLSVSRSTTVSRVVRCGCERCAAAFMADSQVPWSLEALNGAVSEPAWKTRSSWYLVATEDRMIPPDAQRAMSKRAGSTVAEVKRSHAVYVSRPKAVADLIAKAANGVALATR
jgi:Alpha/beta hydrolase family